MLGYNGRVIEAAELREMLDQIPELRAQIAEYKQRFRAIAALCNAPHWTADRRWKIAELASKSK